MNLLDSYLRSVALFTDEWITHNFKSDNSYEDGLYEAMLYSLKAGGKRLRPALVIAGYNLFKDKPLCIEHPAIPFACAVEMLHTYSLIHDDLPGMDNDDIRRGKPTNHKVFGEATAILAGNALLTKSFEIFLDRDINKEIDFADMARAAYILAKNAGSSGMLVGQYQDIKSEGLGAYRSAESSDVINFININKTAKLIGASLACGAAIAGATDNDISNLYDFGLNIGVAFQIVDDILDITATTAELGKPARSDLDADKLTYVSVYGIDSARTQADFLIEKGIGILQAYDGEYKKLLEQLAYRMADRRS